MLPEKKKSTGAKGGTGAPDPFLAMGTESKHAASGYLFMPSDAGQAFYWSSRKRSSIIVGGGYAESAAARESAFSSGVLRLLLKQEVFTAVTGIS